MPCYGTKGPNGGVLEPIGTSKREIANMYSVTSSECLKN
jgi:hypothetical protein